MAARLGVLMLPGTDYPTSRSPLLQNSALRMYPFTWSLKACFGSAVDVVEQVRYRVYGWNGGQASPMWHARAALDLVARRNLVHRSP